MFNVGREVSIQQAVKMVLFHNINVGQKVEVNIGWGLFRGTVQYKGCLTGKQGDWVGVHLEDRGKRKQT